MMVRREPEVSGAAMGLRGPVGVEEIGREA